MAPTLSLEFDFVCILSSAVWFTEFRQFYIFKNMNVCVYEDIFIYVYGSQRTTGQSSTFLETGLLDLNLINYSRLIHHWTQGASSKWDYKHISRLLGGINFKTFCFQSKHLIDWGICPALKVLHSVNKPSCLKAFIYDSIDLLVSVCQSLSPTSRSRYLPCCFCSTSGNVNMQHIRYS